MDMKRMLLVAPLLAVATVVLSRPPAISAPPGSPLVEATHASPPPEPPPAAEIPADPAGAVPIRGRVLDPYGRPVAGALVSAPGRPGVWTDADGAFQPPGPGRLTVRARGFGLTVVDGPASNPIMLSPPGKLVLRWPGAAPPSAETRLFRKWGTEVLAAFRGRGRGVEWIIADVAPGEYEVVVDDGSGRSASVARIESGATATLMLDPIGK